MGNGGQAAAPGWGLNCGPCPAAHSGEGSGLPAVGFPELWDEDRGQCVPTLLSYTPKTLGPSLG